MDNERQDLINELVKQIDKDLNRLRKEEQKAFDGNRDDFIAIAKKIDKVSNVRRSLHDYSMMMKVFDYKYGR